MPRGSCKTDSDSAALYYYICYILYNAPQGGGHAQILLYCIRDTKRGSV
jgi:hypothetical protein